MTEIQKLQLIALVNAAGTVPGSSGLRRALSSLSTEQRDALARVLPLDPHAPLDPKQQAAHGALLAAVEALDGGTSQEQRS